MRVSINNLSNSIREVLGIEGPITNKKMEEIINSLNGQVIYKNGIRNSEVKLKKNFQTQGFEIMIDGEMPDTRNLFTIAHELGYLFLHMGYLDESEWNKYTDNVYQRNGFNNLEESMANEFAGAFLMPENLFKKKVYDSLSNGMYNLSEVAEFFNVSVNATRVRAKYLGLIEW